MHARRLDDRGQLVAPTRVEVVVAENGEDGHVEVAARVGDDLRLLGLAGRREVAREEDHVGFRRDGREGALDAFARRLGCVQVAGCRDADHPSTMLHRTSKRKRLEPCPSPRSTS